MTVLLYGIILCMLVAAFMLGLLNKLMIDWCFTATLTTYLFVFLQQRIKFRRKRSYAYNMCVCITHRKWFVWKAWNFRTAAIMHFSVYSELVMWVTTYKTCVVLLISLTVISIVQYSMWLWSVKVYNVVGWWSSQLQSFLCFWWRIFLSAA